MIEFIVQPAMRVKTQTMSWNIGYCSTFGKKYKDVRKNQASVTFRPPKDGWYPQNVLTEGHLEVLSD